MQVGLASAYIIKKLYFGRYFLLPSGLHLHDMGGRSCSIRTVDVILELGQIIILS